MPKLTKDAVFAGIVGAVILLFLVNKTPVGKIVKPIIGA